MSRRKARASIQPVKVEEDDSCQLSLLRSSSAKPAVKIEGNAPLTMLNGSAGTPDEKPVRWIMVCVEIPLYTRQSMHRNIAVASSKAELSKVLGKWRNPTVKKKDGIFMEADTVVSRLTAAGISLELYPTNCDKALQDIVVRRDFMVKTFGGNGRTTFPSISQANVREHGYNDFMYICPHWQPIAPEVPGAPGLWCTPEEYDHDGEVRRLFTRISKDPALWQYQGQYELKRAQKLSRDEWNRQPPVLLDTWARGICENKWGDGMKARIYARKHPKRSLDDILSDESKPYSSITAKDIKIALSKGEEGLAVYTMRCVAYDIGFQRQIEEKLAQWEQKQTGPGKGKRKAEDLELELRTPRPKRLKQSPGL